jgi:UTP--glucose-1-phosphate uridylyltransferase
VLCAEKLIDNEPFAIMLADDLLDGEPPVMAQMVGVFNRYHSSVLGVEEIDPRESRSYGVIEGRQWDEGLFKIVGVVEKPQPSLAPSNLGVVGRYVFMPGIFTHLRNTRAGSGGEIQLTDAITSLLAVEQVLAYRYYGTRFDCSSKLGYLKATVHWRCSIQRWVRGSKRPT